MLAALAIALLGASPAPATPTIGTVLQSIGNARKGLTTYVVPVTMNGSIHERHLAAFPWHGTGTEYYHAPDKQALQIVDFGRASAGFSNVVGSLGAPVTWSQTYAVSMQGTKAYAGRRDYVLIFAPRKSGDIKTVILLVNPNTWAVDSGTFSYYNGSSVSVTLSYGLNSYDLPVSANVSARLPGFSDNVSIDYGTYRTNVPVPASAFQP